MRRRRLVIGLGVVTVLIGAAVALRPLLLERGHTTQLTLQELEDRFERSNGTAPSSGESAVEVLPARGVYAYATTGRDSVDALGGDHHDYPATTTVTVTTSGCGAQYRWDVAVERWAEWRRCVVGGQVQLVAWTNFDQFFGRSQTDEYACSGENRPLGASRGAVWRFDCTQNGHVDHYEGTVIGDDRATVAGTEVAVTHVRLTIDDGNPLDSQVTDTWYLRGADLIERQTGTNKTTNSSPVGDVHYQEHYEIQLTDLKPISSPG